jgi:hypothetical protein
MLTHASKDGTMLVLTSIATTLSLSGIGIAGVGLSSLTLLLLGAITGGEQSAAAWPWDSRRPRAGSGLS